jgi:NADH-quinone oxidoreductase subunit M
MRAALMAVGYDRWALVALLAIPLVGLLLVALAVALVPGDAAAQGRRARAIALATFVLEFVVSIGLWWSFDPVAAGWQAVVHVPWIPTWGISFSLGIDGISLVMILLTTLTMPLAVLSSWTSVRERAPAFYALLLVMTTGMLGVFMALDLFLFYVMWEVMLVPMYFVIGMWGGARRIYASIKFFIYTFVGSLLMLVAILYLGFHVGRPASPPGFGYDDVLIGLAVSSTAARWLFLAFFLAFAVKVPMFPFHTWLPDAHVEAPTAGSVILAAILLKLGGYGFLRFSLPMFPEATQHLAPLIYALSIIAIVYTSLVALVQEDIKKLIAYSSVAHMGFVTMGIFAVTAQGVAGGIFQMISHGIVSAALFLCVGVVYDRMHTREIAAYGGLVNRMPVYAVIFLVFTLANVGLPGTSGFVGEFLTLIGTFRINTWVATLATLGTILSAAYALWLYRKVIFGKLEKPSLMHIRDIGWREMVILAPLVILTIVFGIYPKPVLDMSSASVTQLIDNYQHALSAVQTAALAR